MYAMYLFLLLISVTSGDYLMTLIVLVLVPTCMYYVKILFELDNTSSVAVKTETFPNKRVPKAVIHKHIAQGCFSFQEAERIPNKREAEIEHNHVFRVSPFSFKYLKDEDKFISPLCPYYKCKRMKNNLFSVQEVGVMQMVIIQNHFRPDLSYKTCTAKFKCS